MEYNGFLYDSSQKIELLSASLLEKPENGKRPFARMPYMGFFKVRVGLLDGWLVSWLLYATRQEAECISGTDLLRLFYMLSLR